MNKLRYVASFSGGKDSTAMLLMLLENGVHIDDIVFADTGLEFPEIYKHIEKVEKYIGRKVTRVYPKRDFEFYMLEHKKTKGKNAGDAGYGWPGFSNRWCNRVLKIDPIDKYLREFKEETVIQYLGISYDEAHRAKNNPLYKYPLIEAKMTSEDNLQFCLDRGFDWGGFTTNFQEPAAGCVLCKESEL